MAATIVSRTISSIVDQKIVLDGSAGNTQIGRTLSIGTSWNRIRIGCRIVCDPNGNTGDFTPAIAFGMCSGTTNMFNSASTTNFLGLVFRAGIAWTLSSQIWFQSGGAPGNVSKRVGTTTTTLSLGLNSWYCAGDVSWRSYILVDITKGSPNFTVGLGTYQTGSVNDTSLSSFYDRMQGNPDPPSPYSSAAVAFDEIAGSLDTVNFYWGTTNRKMEVSEILVYRIA